MDTPTAPPTPPIAPPAPSMIRHNGRVTSVVPGVPIPADVLAALGRATEHVVARAVTVERTYEGETFEFKFLPQMPEQALEIVTGVAGLGELNLSDSEEPTAEQLTKLTALNEALTGFLDVMAVGYTAELIAELMRLGLMDITELAGVQAELVGKVAGRPTSRSSSSAPGSSTPGRDSTASAPGEASTPPDSPSTGS